MKDAEILALVTGFILLLAAAVIGRQAMLRREIRRQIRAMSRRLEEILDSDDDESLMVFTEDQALMELAAAINRMLEEQRKLKGDFRRMEISSRKMLSNISHDIKTPMTVLLGYLELLRLQDGGANEMLAKAEEKAQGVMELIRQFFTLAKLEAGDTKIEISRVEICEICRESVLDFYELLTQKDFTVEIRIPEGELYVRGNREALQRILWNLISNGVRYGAEGKYLGIFLKDEKEEVRIEVGDRGPGIDRAFADSVFERLFTMEDSRSRQIQGNGLGLTIARNLARQLGGEILLESEPGKGTVFALLLKKSPETAGRKIPDQEPAALSGERHCERNS